MNNTTKTFEEGIIQGREERAIEIARRLRREGIAADIIWRVSGIDLSSLPEKSYVSLKDDLTSR